MRLAIVSFTALCLLCAKDAAAAERLKFTIPAGWVDLSPDAPPANIRRAPPAMLQLIKDNKFVIYAADLDHADDGFIENMSVTVSKGAPPITEASMGTVGNGARDEFAAKGGILVSMKTGVVVMGNVHVGRVEIEARVGNIATHQLQYIVPGEREVAAITYTASPETFAAYLPVFEASVAGTQGMHEPKRGIDWREAGMSGVIGGIVAGLGAAFMRKKKKEKEKSHQEETATPARKEWWA